MNNLKEIYDNALVELFKAESIVFSLNKKIKDTIELNIKDKYKDKILIRNENEYKLHGVMIDTYSYETFNKKKIEIGLYFICISKMTKQKEHALKLEIERFEKRKYMFSTNHKVAILHTLNYKVELERLLDNSFGLEII